MNDCRFTKVAMRNNHAETFQAQRATFSNSQSSSEGSHSSCDSSQLLLSNLMGFKTCNPLLPLNSSGGSCDVHLAASLTVAACLAQALGTLQLACSGLLLNAEGLSHSPMSIKYTCCTFQDLHRCPVHQDSRMHTWPSPLQCCTACLA